MHASSSTDTLGQGYATWHRFFIAERRDTADNGFSQPVYMREVRLRYAEQMAHANGYGRKW